MEENKDEKKDNLETTPETVKKEEKVSEPVQEVKEENVPKAETTAEQTVQPNAEKSSEVKSDPNSTKENKKSKKQKEPKPKKKHRGLIASIIVIILAIIIGAIGAVVYCFFFASTEIDLSKYISIDFEGYEGYVSVDEDDVIINEKEIKKDIDDSKIAKKLISKIEDSIEVKENGALMNGDEITINVKLKESFLKENKLKLKSNTVTLKVEGLDETETIDLFEDLEINVSGVSPNLSLSVKNNSKDSFVKKVTYKMEIGDNSSSYNLSGLKNGDVVSIIANIDNANIEESGYVVATNVYEYTIENQPEYVDETSDLSTEALNSIKDNFVKEIKNSSSSSYSSFYAVDSITDNIDYSDEFTASEPTLVKAYLLTPKSSSNYTHNKVYAIYKVTFTSTVNSATYDYYYTAYVTDVAVDKDGLYSGISYYYNVSSEYVSGSYGKSSDDAYTYFIETQKSNFDISEIK